MTRYRLAYYALIAAIILGVAALTMPDTAHGATKAQQLRACTTKHDATTAWPALAACRTRILWKGSRRSGREAVRVGWCESGLRPRAGMPRKKYWGVWQFGPGERRTYGWRVDLPAQIAATGRIHKARGWQPFPQCKPTGSKHARAWRSAPKNVLVYG